MKRFCSQCGKELERKILVCPKCGFKNKKKRSKKRLLILIMLITILLALGSLAYVFREKIISVIGNPLESIAKVQDPDYQAKQEFKGVYERYLVEIRYYNLTTGYQSFYKEDKPKANELVEERKGIIEKMNGINCFSKINLDSNCDNLLNELRDAEKEISELISKKDFYFPPYDCEICQTELEDLLRIVGSTQSTELSDLLFALTTDLKEFNTIELQTVEIRTDDPSLSGIFSSSYFIKRSDNDKRRKEFINKFNEQISLINGALGLNLSKIQQ